MIHSICFNEDFNEYCKLPKLPNGSIIFGLPHANTRFIKSTLNECNPGHYNFYHKICFGTICNSRPLKQDDHMYFTHNSTQLISPLNKLIKYKLFECIDLNALIVGGHILNHEKWELKHTKLKNGYFTDNDENKYSFENCFVAINNFYSISNTYDLKLINFSEFYQSNFNSTVYYLKLWSKNIEIPNEIVSQCITMQLDDPISFTLINCENGNLELPNYLKPFFKTAPLFAGNEFNHKGTHDINYDTLKLFRRWLILVIINNEFPIHEFINNKDSETKELNLDEYIHVADYCGISIFYDLFTLIKTNNEK